MKYRICLIALVFNSILLFAQKDNPTDSCFNMTNKNEKLEKKEIITIQSSDKPLLIKNIETNEITFWDWIERLGGMLGLVGGTLGLVVTFLYVYDQFFTTPVINSKIISFAANFGKYEMPLSNKETESIEGFKCFTKLSINVTKEDLNFSDLKVLAKFENNDKEYTGRIYAPRNFKIWIINGDTLTLQIPQKDLLYYMTTLEKNKTIHVYLTFIIPFKEEDLINLGQSKSPISIQLRFISSEGGKEYNSIAVREMSEEKYIWDDELWTISKSDLQK